MGSPVSLAEQAQPLPPIVREVIPVHSSLELGFLVVSFLGLLLVTAGVVLVKGRTGSRAPNPVRPSPVDGESADPLADVEARRLRESAPGYDVIHDRNYLRRIQEADKGNPLHRTR